MMVHPIRQLAVARICPSSGYVGESNELRSLAFMVSWLSTAFTSLGLFSGTNL